MAQVVGATAVGVWGLISFYRLGRVSVHGLVTGGIAGLVAITPAAGFVDIYSAIIIGAGVWVFVFAVSYGTMWILGKIMPIRVTKEEESVGADIIQHGESAYS